MLVRGLGEFIVKIYLFGILYYFKLYNYIDVI